MGSDKRSWLGAASIALASFLIMSLLGINNVQAQGNYYQDQQPGVVTVFEDCDFRGKGWSIPGGEYPNLERLNIGNDRISSVRVPKGMELVLYKNRKFRNSYVTIDRDVRCLNRDWNNEASSLKVEDRGYQGSDQYDNRQNQNNNSNKNVTSKNVSKVVFDNRVLQKVAPKQWKMANRRYGVIEYKEVSRDRNNVYLQNKFTAEKVRIDLFSNDVTFVNRNGQSQRFVINGLQAGLSELGNNEPRNNKPHNNRKHYIQGECFNYKAYTRGGRGGVKFQGRKGSDQFDTRPFSGRWCQSDNKFAMELTKLDPNTDVIIEIQGKKYTFLANEPHDLLLNDWYRKQFILPVAK